jgi:deferrochelatase/peroxidase EfeB
VGTGPAPRAVVPFYGRHQAGIATPAPAHLLFATFDLDPAATAEDVRFLLQTWTATAARLTQGQPAVADDADPAAAPAAAAFDPAGLTLTVGLGPEVFSPERGLAERRPRWLGPLPPFRFDALDPARSDGDLCVQACAEDRLVLFQAVRELTGLAAGCARPRWTQAGFGPPADPAARGETTRNLQGFKDGTANPRPSDPEFDGIVWVQPDDEPAWLRDGSFLVVRRIRMDLDRWEALSVAEQEAVIGRYKDSGAPLSGTDEFDTPILAPQEDGDHLVPVHSHIMVAAPVHNRGARMLRRGYSYDNGWDPAANNGNGQADAGLLFLSYVRDHVSQFIDVQRALDNLDELNAFITPVGSAVFAIPPGAAEGEYLGQGLFE